jgi:hypothetical protein
MALLDSDTLRVEGYFGDQAMQSTCGCRAVNTCCDDKWKASRPVPKIAIAAPV